MTLYRDHTIPCYLFWTPSIWEWTEKRDNCSHLMDDRPPTSSISRQDYELDWIQTETVESISGQYRKIMVKKRQSYPRRWDKVFRLSIDSLTHDLTSDRPKLTPLPSAFEPRSSTACVHLDKSLLPLSLARWIQSDWSSAKTIRYEIYRYMVINNY